MKNELRILTSYIGMLLMHRPIYNNAGVLKSVKIEGERLKEELLFSFNQAQDKFQITEIINGSYLKLIELSNLLWEKAIAHNVMARSAMVTIQSLLDYITHDYGSFLDKGHALTAFERLKLDHHVSSELVSIEVLLKQKKVSEPLIGHVLKAFEDLFKERKHGVLSCIDRKYIEEFLPQLSDLAHDEREKNWNLRLRRLLVKYNFNHMGVYKFLEAEESLAIEGLREYEKKHDALYLKCLLIEQIQEAPNLAYNVKSVSLKLMLLKHIAITQVYLKEKDEMRRLAIPSKFECNLSVDELSVEFHCDYEEGIFNYLTKKEAAAELIKHIESKAAKLISTHSLTKFDKAQLYNAAINVYRRNLRKQNKLIKNFNIKLSG